MFRIKYIVSYFCFVIALSSLSAHAKTASNFCSDIVNSTDLVACLSQYYKKSKTEMSDVFQIKQDALSDGADIGFRSTQQSWIAYRDAQCEWETQSEPTESLKRIKELYCLVRLTDERTRVLNISLEDLQQQQQHHGVTPRWENVLSEDFKDIFWRKNIQITSDINCNEQQENTIIGVRLNAEGVAQYVVGFVEGSSTGRPQAILYDLPTTEMEAVGDLKEGAEDTKICGNAIEIQFTPPNVNEECKPSFISVKNGSCSPQSIVDQDGQFIIQSGIPENILDEVVQ